MQRYFIEVAYKGSAYAGFQVQENAPTVQAAVEKALGIFFKMPFSLTGSSRTDAGVHALQNYFHFDSLLEITDKVIYNLNAILPADITIKSIRPMPADAHCRFDATSREYRYYVYDKKNPFLAGRAYFFPYPLELSLLKTAAKVIQEYEDFTSFSKRNTQVKNFRCQILESDWYIENDCVVYYVKANRFLRGMVRGLVGTMLQVGRGKTDIAGFRNIIESKNCSNADFSVPGHGLFLCQVHYDGA